MESTQLSEQVKISLEDAKVALRESLGFASKSEIPQINIAISQLLYGVDQIITYYDRPKITFDDMIRRNFEGN